MDELIPALPNSERGFGEQALASPPMRSGLGHLASTFNAARKPLPPKLYRIGEVVDYSGMSRQTIHNYTIMGLLHESRWTRGGHRLYDESVFDRLDAIAQFRAQNRSLEDIREHFAKMDRDNQ